MSREDIDLVANSEDAVRTVIFVRWQKYLYVKAKILLLYCIEKV